MLLVVADLLLTSSSGLVDGQLHGGRDGIRIHDDLAIDVTGGTTCRLRQTPVTAQETLFIGIEDGN